MTRHRGIANRLHWMQEAYALTSADRVLQKTPFSFDVSVWEFFWPLIFGAELVIAEPGGHRDSAYLAAGHRGARRSRRSTSCPRCSSCSSRTRGRAIARASSGSSAAARRCRRLSRTGSSMLLDAELHNLYGPTEAAVDVTAWACDRHSDLSFVPIGKPVANTQMHILDDDMRPVPVGTAGELCIGGIQVGRGYLNRPELTAERFVADPFSDGAGRHGSTGPATWRATCRTATSSSSAAATTRSRSGASASSSARSRRPWRPSPGSARPSSSPASARAATCELVAYVSSPTATARRPMRSVPASGAAARVHGPHDLHRPRQVPPDLQRQGRPQGAPGAGPDPPGARNALRRRLGPPSSAWSPRSGDRSSTSTRWVSTTGSSSWAGRRCRLPASSTRCRRSWASRSSSSRSSPHRRSRSTRPSSRRSTRSPSRGWSELPTRWSKPRRGRRRSRKRTSPD